MGPVRSRRAGGRGGGGARGTPLPGPARTGRRVPARAAEPVAEPLPGPASTTPAPPSPATDLAVAPPPAEAAPAGTANDPVPAPADVAAAEVSAAGAPARCVRLGPFPDEARARAALERVRAWLPVAEVLAVPVPAGSSFWVHVPPRSGEDEARAVVARLAASGIESFVIRDEPVLRNAVSLGVFRDAGSAARHAARFAGIGYPVAVHEAVRERPGVVVEGALAADPQGLEAALGADAGIEELACPVVAEPVVPD